MSADPKSFAGESKEGGFMPRKKTGKLVRTFFVSALIFFHPAAGQDLETLIQSMFSVSSPCGCEEELAAFVMQCIPKGYWKRDNLGSLYLEGNEDESGAVCLAPMDETGYVVSGITEDGYLLLDRVVPADPSFDAYFPGHPMLILTEEKSLSGVLAIPSLHIFPRNRGEALREYFALNSFFVDIGAANKRDAEKRGIRLLNPVVPARKWSVLAGDERAGYWLGRKACCAVLARTAGLLIGPEISFKGDFVWLAQTRFFHRSSRPRASMGALRASRISRRKEVIILDAVPVEGTNGGASLGQGPILVSGGQSGTLTAGIREEARKNNISLQILESFPSSLAVPFEKDNRDVIILGLPVRYFESPSEVMNLKDAERLTELLRAYLHERRAR